MSNTNEYPAEKVPEPEVYLLPAPASAPREKRRSLLRRVFHLIAVVFGVFAILHLFKFHRAFPSGCHGAMTQMPLDDGDHQHPFPPIEKWKPFDGNTHFEFDPATAAGFSVRGPHAFGKVVFTTSKLSNKVVIDLDIKTSKKDKNGDVTVKEDQGHLSIDTPKTEEFETYASAKIQIPSNIIGEFVIPEFEVDVPRHMVDFSGLPQTLDIGTFKIRVAHGFIKTGPVHTNTTDISIANGLLKGSLVHGSEETNIDVANGNITLDISSIASGNQGATRIHIGNGNLNGTLAIYNGTAINVGSGSIYITASFKGSDSRASLSTRIASGSARVYVSSIASDRLLEASHTSVNGDQLITYPSNFQGTVDARGILGSIKLEGKDLEVEKVVGGLVGRQGDSERNNINVRTVRGELDILVGDD